MQPQTPRVVMIGDSSVGKTSLVYRLCQSQWNENTRPTVSTTFYTLKGDPEKYQQSVQIWDTAGAERYRALNSVYYHNSMGGILVFDLTSRQSFESLDSWLKEFTDLAQPGAIVAVVGNKLDLYADADERVRPDDGEKWANVRGLKFFTTSAQDGTGIEELREYMLNTVPQKNVIDLPAPIVDLAKPRPPPAKTGGCC